MKGFSPFKQNNDEKYKAMEVVKTLAPSVILDNPNSEVYQEHTVELENRLMKAYETLKKHGMSREELDDAGGHNGWDTFVNYHGLNIT